MIEEQKLLVENIRHTGDSFRLTVSFQDILRRINSKSLTHIQSQTDERTAADFQKLSLGTSTIDDDDLSVGGGVWLEPGRETHDDESRATKRESRSMGLGGSIHNTSLANWGGAAEESFLTLSTRCREPPPKKESRFARVPVSLCISSESCQAVC